MKKQRGFTLIELLVVGVIMAILIGGLVKILLQSQSAKEAGYQKAQMQANGRAGLELFTREARMAGAKIPFPVRGWRWNVPFSIQPIIAYNRDLVNYRDSVTFWTSYDNINMKFKFEGNAPSPEMDCYPIGSGTVDDFKAGDLIIIWRPVNNFSDIVQITKIQSGSSHIQMVNKTGMEYYNPDITTVNYPWNTDDDSAIVLKLHAITYYCALDSTVSPPRWALFRRDGFVDSLKQAVSDNINQFSLSYFDYRDTLLFPDPGGMYNDTTNSKIRRIDSRLQALPAIQNWAKSAVDWNLRSSARVRSL